MVSQLRAVQADAGLGLLHLAWRPQLVRAWPTQPNATRAPKPTHAHVSALSAIGACSWHRGAEPADRSLAPLLPPSGRTAGMPERWELEAFHRRYNAL